MHTSTASLVLTPEQAERFWSKFAEPDANGCRRWTGSGPGNGYGQFRLNGSMRLQHRVVYTNKVGKIPPGLTIDHLCHVRDCGEVTHLRLADDTDQQRNLSGPTSRNTSGVLGVNWHKASGKWVAQIKVDRRKIYLGIFDVFDDAVAARKVAEAEYGWLTLSPDPQK